MKRIFSAVFLMLMATQVAAVPCADTTHIETQLLAKHGETMSHFGVLPSENLLQVFINERSESWSIIVEVPARGLSCLLATGYGFEAVMENELVTQAGILPMS